MRPLLIRAAAGIVLVGVIATVIWAVKVYNKLVTLEQSANEMAAEIQNGYQRRADLIPNLVGTVKGYATQERDVLESVTRARAGAAGVQWRPEAVDDPKALAAFQAAQDRLSAALGRLLVTVERYPQLKSNTNFMALQKELAKTEDRIARDRSLYNRAVRAYKIRLGLFPGSIVGRLAGYKPKSYFAGSGGTAEPPDVKF